LAQNRPEPARILSVHFTNVLQWFAYVLQKFD